MTARIAAAVPAGERDLSVRVKVQFIEVTTGHSSGGAEVVACLVAPNTGLRKRRDDALHHHGAIHSWCGVRVRRGASYVPALL